MVVLRGGSTERILEAYTHTSTCFQSRLDASDSDDLTPQGQHVLGIDDDPGEFFTEEFDKSRLSPLSPREGSSYMTCSNSSEAMVLSTQQFVQCEMCEKAEPMLDFTRSNSTCESVDATDEAPSASLRSLRCLFEGRWEREGNACVLVLLIPVFKINGELNRLWESAEIISPGGKWGLERYEDDPWTGDRVFATELQCEDYSFDFYLRGDGGSDVDNGQGFGYSFGSPGVWVLRDGFMLQGYKGLDSVITITLNRAEYMRHTPVLLYFDEIHGVWTRRQMSYSKTTDQYTIHILGRRLDCRLENYHSGELKIRGAGKYVLNL